MIESSLLQTLIAVSKTMNFSKAADQLGVTQSAVSQSMKSLETKAGFPIIIRHKKVINLTDEGQKLCKLAEEYFKKFDKTINRIHEEKQQMTGEIHLGTLNGIGKSWLSTKMIEFAKMYPEVQVRISMDYVDKLVKEFHANEINCMVLPEYFVPAHAEAKELNEEFSTLVFPNDERFPIDENLSLKELGQYPMIFFEPNDPLFYRWCREKFGGVPRNISPKLVVNSFGQMMQAVHEGLGIAVIPSHVFKRSFYKDKVKNLGKKYDVFNNKFYFVYHPESIESLKFTKLYDFLYQAAIN